MNFIDWLAIIWALFALWGLTTAIPNWRKSVAHRRRLKREGINGFNERLARKEVRLHRNITVALIYILMLGAVIALPPISLGPLSLSGTLLSAGLLYLCPYLAFWSRAERDDGEHALLELTRIAQETLRNIAESGKEKEE